MDTHKLVLAAAVCSLVASAMLGCDGSPTRCSHVATPVSVSGDRPLTVRAEAGSVWCGAHAWTETRATWAMPARGPVEELTIRSLPDGGHAITFRQGGVFWRGEVDESRSARGPLRAMPEAVDLPAGSLLTAR